MSEEQSAPVSQEEQPAAALEAEAAPLEAAVEAALPAPAVEQPKLYAYNEATVNAVLAYLGKQPAEQVLGIINALLKPSKIELEAKQVVAELV
jgi:hypothetical protein